jgi:hypothetical protein
MQAKATRAVYGPRKEACPLVHSARDGFVCELQGDRLPIVFTMGPDGRAAQALVPGLTRDVTPAYTRVR